jgi:ELWxxDGT repeat protein
MLSPILASVVLAAVPTPVRIADINKAQTNQSGLSPMVAPVELSGRAYIFASLNGRGSTLWSLDTPTSNPKFLLDFSPGEERNNGPSEAVSLPGVGIFFNYYTATEGDELWMTDGSEGGTALVADLRVGPSSSSPSRLTHVHSTVFFTANDGVHGDEPWMTTGTADSTRMLGDLNPSGGSNAHAFVALDALRVLFYANDGPTRQVYVWDGSEVTKVSTFAAHLQITSDPLVIGGTAYLLVRDSNAGNQRSLFSTDGASMTLVTTTSHTSSSNLVDYGGKPHVAVDNASIVYFGGGTEQLVTTQTAAQGPRVLGTKLLFSGYEGGNVAVFAWDGNAKTVLKQFVDLSGEMPQWLGETDGFAYFAAKEAATGRELWRTDGTPTNTTIVKDFEPYSADPTQAAAFAGSLLFYGLTFYEYGFGSSAGSHVLHRTDGSSAGTAAVASPERTDPSMPRSFAAANDGSIFFIANTGPPGVSGLGLLKYNPASPNSQTLTAGAASFALAGSRPVAFRANGAYPSVELWSHDGVSGAPIGGFDFEQAEFVRAGNLVYFVTNERSGTNTATVLWRSDGTGAGTQIVHDDFARDLVAVGNRLVFFSNGELLATSGTLASTVTIYPAEPQTHIVGDHVVFFDGEALYGSDGTSAATLLGDYTGKNPRAFMRARARAYYFVDGATAGTTELWRTTGSPAGTQRVATLAFEGANIYAITNGNAVDYVALSDLAGTGWNLYSVAGTTATPVPGASSLSLCNLLGAGDRALIAISTTTACEVWAADTTGVAPVTVDGKRLSLSDYFYEASDYALFSATDGESGTELWISDGSAALTRRYADIAPGAAGSRPQEYIRAGNALYFTALDETDDREPYVLPLDATPPLVTAQVIGTQVGGFYTSDAAVSFTTSEPDSQVFSTCAPLSVTTDGVTTLRCRSLSLGGVTNTVVTVVRDTTPPVITCPSDVFSAASTVSFEPLVTDNLDPNPVVTADHASGSVFAEGATTVTLTATDAAGLSATCSFVVTVAPQTEPTGPGAGSGASAGEEENTPAELTTKNARTGCACGQAANMGGDALIVLGIALFLVRRRR